jgi:hypothetical protein
MNIHPIHPTRHTTRHTTRVVGGCLLAALVSVTACSSKSEPAASSSAGSTAVPTTPAPSTPPTTPAPSVAPTTAAPEETLPAHSLYDVVGVPAFPGDHTAAPAASGVLADGAYWVLYNGGPVATPDVTVLQAFFGAECESAALADGGECVNDYYVRTIGSRNVTDMPFHANVFLTVSDALPGTSYWITPDELALLFASGTTASSPPGYAYTPFAFMMTVQAGEIWQFEQIWVP